MGCDSVLFSVFRGILWYFGLFYFDAFIEYRKIIKFFFNDCWDYVCDRGGNFFYIVGELKFLRIIFFVICYKCNIEVIVYSRFFSDG